MNKISKRTGVKEMKISSLEKEVTFNRREPLQNEKFHETTINSKFGFMMSDLGEDYVESKEDKTIIEGEKGISNLKSQIPVISIDDDHSTNTPHSEHSSPDEHNNLEFIDKDSFDNSHEQDVNEDHVFLTPFHETTEQESILKSSSAISKTPIHEDIQTKCNDTMQLEQVEDSEGVVGLCLDDSDHHFTSMISQAQQPTLSQSTNVLLEINTIDNGTDVIFGKGEDTSLEFYSDRNHAQMISILPTSPMQLQTRDSPSSPPTSAASSSRSPTSSYSPSSRSTGAARIADSTVSDYVSTSGHEGYSDGPGFSFKVPKEPPNKASSHNNYVHHRILKYFLRSIRYVFIEVLGTSVLASLARAYILLTIAVLATLLTVRKALGTSSSLFALVIQLWLLSCAFYLLPLLICWNYLGTVIDDILYPQHKCHPVGSPLFLMGVGGAVSARGLGEVATLLLQQGSGGGRREGEHSFTTVRLWEVLFAQSVSARRLVLNLFQIDLMAGRPIARSITIVEETVASLLQSTTVSSRTSATSSWPLRRLQSAVPDEWLLWPLGLSTIWTELLPATSWLLCDLHCLDDSISAHTQTVLMDYYRKAIQRHLYSRKSQGSSSSSAVNTSPNYSAHISNGVTEAVSRVYFSMNWSSFSGALQTLRNRFESCRFLVVLEHPVKLLETLRDSNTDPSIQTSLPPKTILTHYVHISENLNPTEMDTNRYVVLKYEEIFQTISSEARLEKRYPASFYTVNSEVLAGALRRLRLRISDKSTVTESRLGAREITASQHHCNDSKLTNDGFPDYLDDRSDGNEWSWEELCEGLGMDSIQLREILIDICTDFNFKISNPIL